jgi:signal recognition particle subunit SRP54
LLEADVNYGVAKNFVAAIRAKALGQEVLGSLTPAQQVVKIVHEELVTLLGEHTHELNLAGQPIATVMVMGLQGSGKTTFCGKLACMLKKDGRTPLLVAADIYRPAAIDQLRIIAETASVPLHSDREKKNTAQIVKMGYRRARDLGCDVMIVDTAGRLHIDDTLMDELVEIDKKVAMHEKLLVLDARTGHEAVNIASEFVARVGFDGAVLTKLDGDARGGAALSVLGVTGRPIKLVGVGEKLQDLEVFHPDRMAGRILGMGDVMSLIEQAEEKMDVSEADELMKRMGPLKNVLGLLPGMNSDILDKAKINDKQFVKVEAIINSMTLQERRRPDIINGSRRKRIARGSGTNVSQVNKLLKQYRDMRRMMRQINSEGGLQEFSQKVLGGES